MLSFNKEQSIGQTHNMVVVVMRQFNFDIAAAVEWIRVYHEELQGRFMEKYLEIPRWGGPIDRLVSQYVDGIANWVRANDQWHFESQRYFGKRGSEVQKTRWVELLPLIRSDPEDVGPIVWDMPSQRDMSSI